jgi:hypothetical protein
MRCQPLSQMQHNRAQIYRWRGAPDWGIVQTCIIRRWTLRSHWTYIIYFLAVIHFIPSSYSYRVPSSLCLNFYLVHSTLCSKPFGCWSTSSDWYLMCVLFHDFTKPSFFAQPNRTLPLLQLVSAKQSLTWRRKTTMRMTGSLRTLHKQRKEASPDW